MPKDVPTTPEVQDPFAPPKPSRDLVNHDAPCLGCGYNLKGLTWSGRCPECAAPIWISLQEKLLCYADPQWLRRVRRGSKLAVAGLLIPFVAFLPMIVWPCTNDPAIHTFVSYTMAIIVAVGALCWATGLWEVTAPNPADTATEKPWSPRRVARAALLAGLAASAVAIALTRSRAGALLWGAACFSLPGLPAPVIFWAMGRHVELLARGIANKFVEGRARGYRHGFIISWLAALMLAPTAALLPPLALLEILAVPALLTFLVYCLLLPTYLLRDITRDLQLSEQLRAARLPAVLRQPDLPAPGF
jgi:hypothetical protein